MSHGWWWGILTPLLVRKRRGGLPFRVDEGVELSSFMSTAGVFDAGFSGSCFTWCNNRGGHARIWKRLDKLLCSPTTALRGVNFEVRHLGREPSDHAPLLLSALTRLDNKPRPFCFLNVWTLKVELLDVIRVSWASACHGRPLQQLAAKLRLTKHAIQQWSREHFGNIFDAVKQAEEAVMAAEAALDSDLSQQQWLALQEARAVLKNSLVKEEAYWRQKARIKWLQDGDKNSRFFHAVVAENMLNRLYIGFGVERGSG
ncbi:uncharacterized protein [Coffea arabica]|uniref:Uncharacterized protein n=1 Tax=Coffea arabica TaxID=13443 RepID=A0ABM4VZA4_COFAR